MSLLPDFDDALEHAAQRHYGRRRARSWGRWVAAPVAVVVGAALVVALLPRTPDVEVPAAATAPPPLTVPLETLARSRALAGAPLPESGPGGERIPHAQLPAVAAEIAASVPYPPGAGESMDWAGLPVGPRDMASVNVRADVQRLVEYRAACVWATFWLYASERGELAALSGATAVLGDVPHWPTQRGALADPFERTVGWPAVATAAQRRDVAPVRAYAAPNCARVPSPYAAAIR